MEKEEKALSLLLDAIETFGFSKDVHVKFVRELIKRLNLSIADCFPDNKLSSLLSVANDMCSKLGQSLTAAQEVVVTKQSHAPKSAKEVKKGYSRHGKKLGRPKKTTEEKNEGEVLLASVPTGEKTAETKAEIPTEAVNDPMPTAKAENTAKTTAKQVEFRELSEEEKQEIENLKMGKEYPNDILYVWRNLFVISNRILQEGQPLGVFVNYKRRTLDYDRFVLYLSDEMQGLPISKAIAYARNKLPEYRGEKWKLIDRWQIESIKQSQPELNQILRKIGGDSFSGNYLTEIDLKNRKTSDKIRYAVNVIR